MTVLQNKILMIIEREFNKMGKGSTIGMIHQHLLQLEERVEATLEEVTAAIEDLRSKKCVTNGPYYLIRYGLL